MLELVKKLEGEQSANLFMLLGFDIRQKSRFKTVLTDGQDVGVILPRGQILRGGDYLASVDNEIVQVLAEKEEVSVVYSDDQLLLSKICYHLGNRHVPLQIEAQRISYGHDSVLDNMVKQFGLEVCLEDAVFEPEIGAYGHSSHQISEPQRSKPKPRSFFSLPF
jgi:urease accessory protein